MGGLKISSDNGIYLLENKKYYFMIFLSAIETWLYNKEEKIYIEISPTFCWDDSEGTESDKKCFNHFLRNYKRYDVLEISKENADLWIQKCENILKGLGK